MTRDDILGAAAQIFREKGFHAASMQDIAEAVNLQKASLYYHVSSKQEILLALLDRALDLLIERMQLVLAQPLSPDEKVRQAMRYWLPCWSIVTWRPCCSLSIALLTPSTRPATHHAGTGLKGSGEI
jgi:AcrR family transcriptional regulator